MRKCTMSGGGEGGRVFYKKKAVETLEMLSPLFWVRKVEQDSML